VSGHGYDPSLIVKPACTCGWSGTATNSQMRARGQFERHKTIARAAREHIEGVVALARRHRLRVVGAKGEMER
jgi:hypothetical protein